MPQPERMTSALMPRRGAARPIGDGSAPISAEGSIAQPTAVPAPAEVTSSEPHQVGAPVAEQPLQHTVAREHPTLQPAAPSISTGQTPSSALVPPRRAPASTATTPMTVRFDPEMHRRLKEIAFFEGTSIAAIIEQATKEWMQRRGEG